jgi:uncharacterized protein (TIGR02246 family)
MYRWGVMLVAAIAAGGLVGWIATADRTPSVQAQAPRPVDPAQATRPAEPALPPEAGIKAITAAYAKAYNAADARAAAALWTTDGEYVGDDGEEIKGRDNIEKSLAKFFKDNPKATAEVRVESVRQLGRGLASAEGVVALKMPGNDPVVESRYTALHVLEDGVWRAASVREWVPDPATTVTPQQLEWLIGEWTAKGDGGDLRIVYAWDENKVFITGKFTITKEGKTVTSGTQVIGRNPKGGLRSWLFDSNGTTSDGYWERDDDRWINEAEGVLSDGTEIKSVNVLIKLGPDAFTWQTTERTIDDIPVQALPPIKVTRVKK